ncbi:hypothetical protein E8E12_001038 [Didymella heteroderae]|uniref:HORMA domain-containing protein n=1 Tax=Didymella heteroderae TaxID=1769908 RepID=A0A9P4WFK6_9PLEO|nr:hypothetical protein E8E12_001038 [Didymella heteroderae]
MAGATYIETLDAFTNFVTAYVHTLLHLRSLYPRTTFVQSRFHNTSVYQSRHPLVCDWIRNAVDAVRTELLNGTVSRIAIVIFDCGNGSKSGSADRGTGDAQIIERFMIDVSTFPVLDKDEKNAVPERASTPTSQISVGTALLESGDTSGEDDEERCHDESEAGATGADTSSRRNRSRQHSEPNEPPLDISVDTNLAEQMRAVLILLTTRCAQLKPLPDKCSFNIAVELKNDVDVGPPIEHSQAWTAVQPTQESSETEDKRKSREHLGTLRFTPIGTVETGTFRFETWVEKWWAKFEDMGDKAPDSPEGSFTGPKIPAHSEGKGTISFSTSSGDSMTI